MKNELMIFEGQEVEVLELNGKVLFNPKHVAEILEIADVNSSIRKFNDKQITRVKNSDVHNMHIRKLNNAGENFLTESGVYKLVFKSHKPNAEEFTDWITDEVLPSIRKTGSYEMPKKESNKQKKKNLSSVNMAAKIMQGIYKEAGVEPLYIAVAVDNLYKNEAGIDFGIQLTTKEERLYDYTEMAKLLGIMSKTSNPHDKAVSAIIQKIEVLSDEIIRTPFERNGHADVTIQYKESVFIKVKEWLKNNNYPLSIPYQLSNGKINNCTVYYKDMEVA